MRNNKEIYNLIDSALDGNTAATFNLILQFEPMINKYSRINGEFDQECKDYIIDNLLKQIKKFKKN